MIDVIYCGGGNRRFAEIAVGCGMKYGSRLPETVYLPLDFADQDWKHPDRAGYMAALAEHCPEMATVLDWERAEQLDEVLAWAEEAAQYVQTIVIIPKVPGRMWLLPRQVGGADVRLGFSVATEYGWTEVPVSHFRGWPVHLLGGSPDDQLRMARYFDVRSVDGNYFQKAAVKGCRYWDRAGGWHGVSVGQDAPYRAFECSCRNILQAWRERES